MRALFIDDDTIRTWCRDYQEDGIEGLTNFGHEGGSCRLTAARQDKLKVWIAAAMPRTTRAVGAWIAREYRTECQARSALIALMHRMEMEQRKPKAIASKLDAAKQAAFSKE